MTKLAGTARKRNGGPGKGGKASGADGTGGSKKRSRLMFAGKGSTATGSVPRGAKRLVKGAAAARVGRGDRGAHTGGRRRTQVRKIKHSHRERATGAGKKITKKRFTGLGREENSDDDTPMESQAEREAKKSRSALFKEQARERMMLKEQLRDLQARRARTRKGSDAKVERREMGKLARAIKTQLMSKQAAQLQSANQKIEVARQGGVGVADVQGIATGGPSVFAAVSTASAPSAFMAELTQRMQRLSVPNGPSALGNVSIADRADAGDRSALADMFSHLTA